MLLLICGAVTLVCATSFLRASSPSLLLVLLLAFAAAELAFGMMVASLFSNAKIAGIAAPLAHFACLLPRYIFFRTGAPQACISNPCPHASQERYYCWLPGSSDAQPTSWGRVQPCLLCQHSPGLTWSMVRQGAAGPLRASFPAAVRNSADRCRLSLLCRRWRARCW